MEQQWGLYAGRCYASTADVATLWRALHDDEHYRAEQLLPVVSAQLRAEARQVGRDLDAMIDADPDLALVARSVVVDVVARTLAADPDGEAMTMSQMTQSAGGYSATGTFLVPGGGIFIKKSELARLGLRRQRFGGLDVYGMDTGH